MFYTLLEKIRPFAAFLFIAAIWVLSGPQAMAQANFHDLLKTRNYDAIQSSMGEEVDLCIMDVTQINTRSEAIGRIKKFLNDVGLVAIEPLHKGKSEVANSKYSVYKMTTKSSEVRVFVYYESVGQNMIIREIRFDKF